MYSFRTAGAIALLTISGALLAQVQVPSSGASPAPVQMPPAAVPVAKPVHVVDPAKINRGVKRFRKVDFNKNAKLSYEEVRLVGFDMTDFRALDVNSDNSITADELGQ